MYYIDGVIVGVEEINIDIKKIEKEEEANEIVKKINNSVGIAISKKISVCDDGKVEAEVHLDNEIAVAKTDERYITAEFFNTRYLLCNSEEYIERRVFDDVEDAEKWLNEKEEEVKRKLEEIAAKKIEAERKREERKILVVEYKRD